MANYLESVDGTILSQGNLLRSESNALVVPRIIDERLSQMQVQSKLDEILNTPKHEENNKHWKFQRNIQLVDCFLDTCRMIQIEHKGYFTQSDICDSFNWLLNKPKYIGIYAWFNTNKRSIEEAITIFVNIIVNNVMFLPRSGLDPISKIYYLNDKFELTSKDAISLMQLHDRSVNGKPTVEYKLTESVIQYLQVIEDTKRYSEFEINFESLQEQLQLDVLNPNDVLFKIRNAIQKLDILTQKVEEAYQEYVRNISSKTVDSFFENVSNWHRQATDALIDGQKSLANLKEKVLSLRLQSDTASSDKAREKLGKWLDCQHEERKYINDLTQSLKLLSELTEKAITPEFSEISETNLRNINEVFNVQSLNNIETVFKHLAPLFISEKKRKMFNFEVLFSTPPESKAKQAKSNQELSKQVLTVEQQMQIKKDQEQANNQTLKLVKEFLLAWDEAIEPVTVKEFLKLYESTRNGNTIGQSLKQLIIKNKRLRHFLNFHTEEFRKILQALTVYNTTLPLKDMPLNSNVVGLNKSTIAHCIFDLKLDYYYIFKNMSDGEEATILTPDNREVTNLVIAKVRKEDLINESK